MQFKIYGFFNLKGTDISYWSIDYGKKTYLLGDILEYYNVNLLTRDLDFLFLLDVLEHIPSVKEIRNFLKITNAKKIVVRIPVSKIEGDPFVFAVSRNDITHVQCHTKEWWINLFYLYNFNLIKKFNTLTIHDSEGVFAGVFEKC
ncbi:hypothetical protein LCGC14_1118280 [marine sediment metagenome]|uniref:Methyltransferase type 11 domain-containing protein n=1 Tax=marine sediment metagenome TaxID=412755 RepID=A0A0F9QAL1_9ZZZZ